jgi:hypothetical protein
VYRVLYVSYVRRGVTVRAIMVYVNQYLLFSKDVSSIFIHYTHVRHCYTELHPCYAPPLSINMIWV